MLTFSKKEGAACSISTASATFDVFPAKVPQDSWCLLSHPEDNLTSKKVISWPGEYDFLGATIRGIGQEGGKQISYVCYVEHLRIALIDGPVLEWTDTDIERIGEIDVLVVAADSPKKVLALVEAIDPRIVILFETKNGDLVGTAKSCGVTQIQPVAELKVKPGSLPQNAREVVILG